MLTPTIPGVPACYFKAKADPQYVGIVIGVRLGDYYQFYNRDAEAIVKICKFTLTEREDSEGNRVPMVGVPFASVEKYLGILLEEGFKCALIDGNEVEPRSGLRPFVVDSISLRQIGYFDEASQEDGELLQYAWECEIRDAAKREGVQIELIRGALKGNIGLLHCGDIEKASDFMTTPEWRWLLPNCLKALKMATARCEFERSCLTPQQVLLHEEKVN